jgi:hypothetical protein
MDDERLSVFFFFFFFTRKRGVRFLQILLISLEVNNKKSVEFVFDLVLYKVFMLLMTEFYPMLNPLLLH